jgi:hypothetical protein
MSKPPEDEISRLKAQRDRAWLALNSIEDMLIAGESDPLVLALPLAAYRGPRDCEEFNRLLAQQVPEDEPESTT